MLTKLLGYFFPRKNLCINFDKNGLGYILGHFYTNATDHPGYKAGKQIIFRIKLLQSNKGTKIRVCAKSMKSTAELQLVGWNGHFRQLGRWQLSCTMAVESRVARWFIFKTKNPSLGGPCYGKNVGISLDHLEYFTAIWYNLWPFGIFCDHLVYFSQFGKSGPRKIWQPWRRAMEHMVTGF
jgi:hypothetical protein